MSVEQKVEKFAALHAAGGTATERAIISARAGKERMNRPKGVSSAGSIDSGSSAWSRFWVSGVTLTRVMASSRSVRKVSSRPGISGVDGGVPRNLSTK